MVVIKSCGISVTALEMASDDARPSARPAKRRAVDVEINAGARVLG